MNTPVFKENSMKKQIISIALTVSLILIAACTVNPITGKKEFTLMSKQQELALGQQSDPGIVASFGLYQDEKLQAFINEKGTAMGKISHRPDLEYKFKILDSPVVNAFAVPGGYVYFTRGIMAHFNNEAEFAGVLGHEIGHITARHSAKQYTKATLAQIGLIAGVVFSPEFRQYADVASQGLQLLFLKFGRDNESQSDELGVQYSTKIGYDAQHMANFFNTLDRLSGDQSERLPTFLSTHPDPADRNQKVGELAKEWKAKVGSSNYKVNRDSYLRMIDGIVYGDDPRQGYVENDQFYHPELKFQYSVPRGWKTVNSPQQVQMAPSDGKAMIILTLGQGKTLKEAAQKFLTDNKLTLVESQNTTVNGLNALAIISDQLPEQSQQMGATQQSVAQKPGTVDSPNQPSSDPNTQTKQSKTDSKSGSTSGKTSGSGGTVKSGSTNTSSPTPSPTTGNNQSPSQPAPAQGVTPTLRIMTYLIQYNDLIYMFHGLSKYEDFRQYTNAFANTMKSFRQLTDQSKIQVKPERVFIKEVKQSGTLKTALQAYGMTPKQQETLSVLNGMELTARVNKGSLIKILGK